MRFAAVKMPSAAITMSVPDGLPRPTCNDQGQGPTGNEVERDIRCCFSQQEDYRDDYENWIENVCNQGISKDSNKGLCCDDGYGNDKKGFLVHSVVHCRYEDKEGVGSVRFNVCLDK